MLFFQGDALKSRVKKICEGFRATLYQCPNTAAERQEITKAVNQRISEINNVLAKSEDQCKDQLNKIASELHKWRTKVRNVI